MKEKTKPEGKKRGLCVAGKNKRYQCHNTLGSKLNKNRQRALQQGDDKVELNIHDQTLPIGFPLPLKKSNITNQLLFSLLCFPHSLDLLCACNNETRLQDIWRKRWEERHSLHMMKIFCLIFLSDQTLCRSHPPACPSIPLGQRLTPDPFEGDSF